MIIERQAIRDLSLAGLQGLNHAIYGVQNDINYCASDMITNAHDYGTRVLKAVRKGKHENIGHLLCMGFSWSLALANQLHINLDEESWARFPGCCPYCGLVPCGCHKARPESRKAVLPVGKRPATLREYQAMFRAIYPITR